MDRGDTAGLSLTAGALTRHSDWPCPSLHTSGAADDVRAGVSRAAASIQHREASAAAQGRVSAVHFHVVAAAAIREVHHAQHRWPGGTGHREEASRREQHGTEGARDASAHGESDA